MPAHKTLDVPAVATRYGVSAATIYTWIKKRLLPPRVKVPGTVAFWYESSILEWEIARGCKPLTPAARSPLHEKVETIELDQLVARWGIEVATLQRWATMPLFPKMVDAGLFNMRQVEFIEAAHGGLHEFASYIRLEEADFNEDVRLDDGDFSATVQP